MQGKAKGNSYERKVAKQLGKWIFNDETMLWRESTSGMRKVVYRGDIVPAKAHEFPWSSWPFLFEVKTGYKPHTPTLMNQQKIREWLVKLMSELNSVQFTPMLIAQFHSYTPILLTTTMFDFTCELCLMQRYEDFYYQFFIYSFNDILKTDFYKVCPDSLLTYINKSKEILAIRQEEKEIPRKKRKEKCDLKYQGIEHLLGDVLDESTSNDNE